MLTGYKLKGDIKYKKKYSAGEGLINMRHFRKYIFGVN